MLGINMQNVDAAGGNRPGAGGYIIRITKAINVPDKQRLEIEYDIADGQFRDYYRDLHDRRGFWLGRFIKSYKANAQPFLKAFIQTVQECNDGAPGLVIGDFDDIDESKLPGMLIGIVYGMEEYIGNDGKVKQRPDHYGAEFVSLEKIRNGEFEVPELKYAEGVPGRAQQQTGGVIDTTAPGFTKTDEDMPF